MEKILEQIKDWKIEDLLKLNKEIYLLIDGINRDFLFNKMLHAKSINKTEIIIPDVKPFATKLVNILELHDIEYWEDFENISKTYFYKTRNFGTQTKQFFEDLIKRTNLELNKNFKFKDGVSIQK